MKDSCSSSLLKPDVSEVEYMLRRAAVAGFFVGRTSSSSSDDRRRFLDTGGDACGSKSELYFVGGGGGGGGTQSFLTTERFDADERVLRRADDERAELSATCRLLRLDSTSRHS